MLWACTLVRLFHRTPLTTDHRLVLDYYEKLRLRSGGSQSGLRQHLCRRLQAELYKDTAYVGKEPSTSGAPALATATSGGLEDSQPWFMTQPDLFDHQSNLSDQALLDIFAHNAPDEVPSPFRSAPLDLAGDSSATQDALSLPGWPAYLLDLFNQNTEAGPVDRSWVGL